MGLRQHDTQVVICMRRDDTSLSPLASIDLSHPLTAYCHVTAWCLVFVCFLCVLFLFWFLVLFFPSNAVWLPWSDMAMRPLRDFHVMQLLTECIPLLLFNDPKAVPSASPWSLCENGNLGSMEANVMAGTCLGVSSSLRAHVAVPSSWSKKK